MKNIHELNKVICETRLELEAEILSKLLNGKENLFKMSVRINIDEKSVEVRCSRERKNNFKLRYDYSIPCQRNPLEELIICEIQPRGWDLNKISEISLLILSVLKGERL